MSLNRGLGTTGDQRALPQKYVCASVCVYVRPIIPGIWGCRRRRFSATETCELTRVCVRAADAVWTRLPTPLYRRNRRGHLLPHSAMLRRATTTYRPRTSEAPDYALVFTVSSVGRFYGNSADVTGNVSSSFYNNNNV